MSRQLIVLTAIALIAVAGARRPNPADPLPLLKDAIDTVKIRGGGG